MNNCLSCERSCKALWQCLSLRKKDWLDRQLRTRLNSWKNRNNATLMLLQARSRCSVSSSWAWRVPWPLPAASSPSYVSNPSFTNLILGKSCVHVISHDSVLHVHDFLRHRFNYRATHYMAMNGFYNFLNWFDERAWYPLGRIVGGTVYPGLMVTSGFIHWVLNSLHFPVHIRDVCVFLAPMFRCHIFYQLTIV